MTVVTFLLYVLDRTRRERKIQRGIQSASNTLEASSGGEAPLPAVMVRLGDGDIVWGNHRFSELTGYADTMTQLRLEEVLPDFTLDWLTAGKTKPPRCAQFGQPPPPNLPAPTHPGEGQPWYAGRAVFFRPDGAAKLGAGRVYPLPACGSHHPY